jgi:predicted Zn-dependent protease
MSTESENPKSELPRRGRRGGPLRRLGQWWSSLWVFRLFSRLASRLYDWWFPISESSHGYYGYSGPSRQNRIKWLWRRLRRQTRKSFVGSAFREAKARWHDWWYPVSDPERAHSYYGYGQVRRNRLVRNWYRLKRFVRRSFLGRAYDVLTHRLYDWWYPPVTATNAYPAYGYHRSSRLGLAWGRARRRLHSSWLGRKYRALANALYEWYFPLVEGSGYGYGYGSYYRLSRPGLLMRRGVRWFRRTWLGRKTGWVLDEADDLIIQARSDFAWRRVRMRLRRWQTWAVLACLILATWAGHKYGLPRYRQYAEKKYALQAQQFAARRDVPRAMLRARQVFALNPDNPVAIRIFADLADYFGSPYALQWRQRLVQLNPDPTNRLALARTALRTEAFPFPTATRALNEIAPAGRQSPAYHLVAGALAVKLSNLPAAEQHYAEALKLNPDDPASRMSLAVVRLQSGNPNLIADSRTTLELLRTDRQLGLLAMRSLVGESVARREFGRAEAFSRQILTNQQVSFSDRIVHLAILNAEKSPRFESFLVETKKRAEENPYYVGELASWMNRFGSAQAALDWLNGLPPRLARQGLVPIVVADSYAALGQWKALAGFLERERWMEMDAVRIGMMAFASRKQFGDERYSTTWQQAILMAAQSPAMLNTLAEMASGWGWKQETGDVLWFAALKYPDENWPLTALENLYTGQRDTAGLRRVFRARVKKDPGDALARNNFVMVSLLLGEDMAEAHRAAAELRAAEPENPVFASTYAFSLYRQGRPLEAARALRALGLDRLDDPALAAYYGVFLSATGDSQTARTYLDKAAKAFLLPEEQAMVERAKQAM